MPARRTPCALIERASFAVVDAGPLANARQLGSLALLHIHLGLATARPA